MGQNRSADPWSTFLGQERVGSRPYPPGWTASPPPGSGGQRPAEGDGAGPDGTLSEKCRRVLGAVTEEGDAVSVETLHDRLGMSLLDVADAVRALSLAGLVEVIRDGTEELVRPAGLSGTGQPE